MTRYFITGGAGFIGSHLSELLIREGHFVESLDDLSTGTVRNIEQLRNSEKYRHVTASLCDEALLAECIDRADVVIHLAAAVGVMLVVESPVRTIETNVTGTEIVLRHSSKKRKKVMIASTSEVYGKSTDLPFREDGDLVIGPTTHGRWSYACSKALDEFLALAHFHEKKLPVVVTRFFNTVGPRQTGRYGMVVPRFVRQALSGGPITVFGDGGQSRCFCDVSDVVRAVYQLSTNEKAVGGVFNLGSTEEVTILGLAQRIIAKVDPKVQIEYVPYDKAYEAGFEDMRKRVPSTDKIRNLIGWKPTKTLDEILDRVIAYERNHEG
ncbi:MAG: GDP-mannose 4,6-dehydratase [Planctomycetes bacterium]|nr:GDP-mannose 4,6-dehydratase [Planctomycetota bacterium]